MTKKGWHARGYLPHYDTTERVQHVIFRCTDSLTHHDSDLRSGNGAASDDFDSLLDRGLGRCPLRDSDAAEIVQSTMMFRRDQQYRLLAWRIMPNYVQAAIEVYRGYRLGDIVKEWKTFSARRINARTRSSGALWSRDYFDRYMRDEDHLATTIHYIVNNPVKAGLVSRAEDWFWSSASNVVCEPGGSRS